MLHTCLAPVIEKEGITMSLVADTAMRTMAQLLQQRRPPSDLMALTAAKDDERGPYELCPCRNGNKFRFCHGNTRRSLPSAG